MKKLLLILFICPSLLFAQKGVPDEFCLTADEYRLYELINAHRLINGMKEIPLSASLSFVARTHVIDLFTNHPDTGVCNLNSWSDKGEWTACCHNKYVPKEACIRDKPKELTKYTGEGYELTYAEVLNTNADTVFHFWNKIDEANEFLLNEGKWEEKTWRAMGVGIYKSYAVLWMGQRTDALPEPEVCESAPTEEVKPEVSAGGIQLISKRTDRYYVIIASFQSEDDARKEAGKYEKMEGADLKILKNNQGQYRISINDYPNLDEAKVGKETYKTTFTGAWILNY
jgi:hypothetical protein